MAKSIVFNKYRNELGRKYRKLYDNGIRNKWCNRASMRSYQCRPDKKSGTVVTFVQDNLILELYETSSDLSNNNRREV